MIKIAVFGFYCPDDSQPGDCRSPASTRDFLRVAWEMEPPASRIGHDPNTLGFAKLTQVFIQPVYVQALGDDMASSAGLLKSDGYIAIIDAVKILAPNAIRVALRKLSVLHPGADLIIAAGRQNEPDALSSDEIRDVLRLHPHQLIMPYVPDQPKTVYRIIRRLVRYIDNTERIPPPIFAGDVALSYAPAPERAAVQPAAAEAPPNPRVYGLARVGIAVRDMDRALAFYRDRLGLRVLGRVADSAGRDRDVLHLDAGRGVLELIASGGDTPPPPDALGLRHLSLRVAALDRLVEALAAAGVHVLLKPVTTEGVRRAVISDPDGTPIELVEGDVVYARR